MDRHFSCHSIRSMICYSELKTSEIEKRIRSCDMVLLKVLEVDYVNSKRFPNISNLVHLRYLFLTSWNCKLLVLPSSIRKLQNLQILILRVDGRIKVPDFIWDMVKLRLVHISEEALLEVDSNRLQNTSCLSENLRSLSNALVSWGDSKWLSRLLGLQKLRCVFMEDDLEVEDVTKVDNKFPTLSFNDNLISLKMNYATYWKQTSVSKFQFPISLQELTLSEFYLQADDISTIGTLPQLEVFKIYCRYEPSKYQWNVDDGDFPRLKFLKLRSLKISKWFASEGSFPRLEQLWMEKCNYLDEIPLDFGSLANLRLSVRECAPSVDGSARIIEKQQHDELNTEMRVRIYPRKW